MKEYQSFVYAISNGTHIKIGITKDIFGRMKQLQTGNHNKLKLIKLVPGGKDMETELHKKFEAYAVSGEWFKPQDALLRWIDGSELYDNEIAICKVNFNKNEEFDVKFTEAFFDLHIVDKRDCLEDIRHELEKEIEIAQNEMTGWAQQLAGREPRCIL